MWSVCGVCKNQLHSIGRKIPHCASESTTGCKKFSRRVVNNGCWHFCRVGQFVQQKNPSFSVRPGIKPANKDRWLHTVVSCYMSILSTFDHFWQFCQVDNGKAANNKKFSFLPRWDYHTSVWNMRLREIKACGNSKTLSSMMMMVVACNGLLNIFLTCSLSFLALFYSGANIEESLIIV